ncbi:hypothetical protein P3X46_026276 [Hevea brasiliensis]|uniref:Lipase n=1 Tax=Hevea brasiliensis TaxID=3981 RepID=A0ABQ9KXJ8_HEVBR|nr:triacylglycerol lipase 2-like [Hevea brasiliensis]KAJ9152744.1 hypothetical protein P3X46_026276 [Hevea brasiliensis]
MALHGLSMLFAGFALFILNLLLMLMPHHAYGQNNAPAVGLCDSFVRIHGYECDEFQVTTQDGYILGLQRIPKGLNTSGDSANKPPVLLQHGILVDGACWLINAPEQNLPMILADKGFDVWIANTRGTRFSRQHTSLQPSQSEFWNWSWDELAAYDLSAVIDYVHEQTGQKLRYVGHSLGTLIALASFSEGLLVDKVQSAALFSPIAYLSHLKTALGNFVARSFVAEDIAFFGIAEFNLLGEPAKRFLETACAAPGVDCFDLLNAITGKNCCLNASAVDFFLENEPQSTSTKNFVHLAQTVRDGVVAKYNYGNSTNMIRYGASKPPIYNLSNIPQNLPLFLSYGGQDDLSDTQDVQHLLDNLQSHDVTVQFVEDFAHADFVFGVNASDIVYSQVYNFFVNHQY